MKLFNEFNFMSSFSFSESIICFTSIIYASFGSKVYVRGGKIDLLLMVLTPNCFRKWRYPYLMLFWDVVVSSTILQSFE